MKSQPPPSRHGKKEHPISNQGFTLPEILIGVAVLSVLTALIFGALQRTTKSARSAECLSNMRQYGTAVLMFVADNNNTLPNRASGVENAPALRYGSWVQPYLSRPLKEFRCPLATSQERELGSGFGYTGNGALTEYFPTLRDIPAPLSRVVLASEMYDWSSGFWVSGHFNRTIWGNGNGGAIPSDEGKVRRPQYHGSELERGLHMFFVDGHARLVIPTRNDWNQGPTLGNATNGGIFYTSSQFSSLKNGRMIVR